MADPQRWCCTLVQEMKRALLLGVEVAASAYVRKKEGETGGPTQCGSSGRRTVVVVMLVMLVVGSGRIECGVSGRQGVTGEV